MLRQTSRDTKADTSSTSSASCLVSFTPHAPLMCAIKSLPHFPAPSSIIANLLCRLILRLVFNLFLQSDLYTNVVCVCQTSKGT